jgi:PAS domain S-box-containing protein
MKVLYWASPTQPDDVVTIQGLSRDIPGLEIETASSTTEALTLIGGVGGFDFLLISPALTPQEKLSAIATLRKSGTPISIVPIVIQSHPDASAAMAVGAGDVLLLAGTFGTPLEKLMRLSPRLRLAARQPDPPLTADAGARTRFDAMRRDLQARLDAQYHAALEGQLTTARSALEQARRHDAAEERIWVDVCQRFENERAAQHERFAATRRDLEWLLTETKAVKTDYSALYAELSAVLEALAQACTAFAAQRKVRDELCARLETELATERERFDAICRDLEQAKADLAQVTETHRTDSAAWETNREQLEQRVRQADLISAETQTTLSEERARAAARHERLMACSPLAHGVMTLDGRLVRCNDRLAKMFGYADAGDALERTARSPFPPTAGRHELDARLLAEGQIAHVESYLSRADGQTIRVVESAMVVSGGPGDEPSVERIFADMSTRSEIEEQHRHARRLEEVGKLAVAVTTQVEALVCAIDACATEWSAAQTPQDPSRTPAEMIAELSGRADALLRQLLTFSRQQVRQPGPVDLNAGVSRAESMLVRLVGPHIELKLELGTARMIALDWHDLEQILGALVISAREHLPFGGRLVVRTGLATREPAAPGRDSGDRGGPKLVIAVVASGYGVRAVQPTETLESVVRRCGGTVEVESDAGQRVALRVYLPDCLQPAPAFDQAV